MTRRRLPGLAASLAAALLSLAGPPPAALADTADEIAAELRAGGYDNIRIERTLLGRIRITAETDEHLREIVIDRGTGEILRDLSEDKPAAAPAEAGEAPDPAEAGGAAAPPDARDTAGRAGGPDG